VLTERPPAGEAAPAAEATWGLRPSAPELTVKIATIVISSRRHAAVNRFPPPMCPHTFAEVLSISTTVR